MPAVEADVQLAREVANQIVRVGQGRVRRIVMVGSRALGTARPNSDLDLVVLVELPATERAWTSADCMAERNRILQQLHWTGIKPELWLRTMSQYEDFRRIECSFEWRVAAEGVEIYRRMPDRRPVARRSLDAARREIAHGWIDHAMRGLAEAATRENEFALKGLTLPDQARRATESAIMRAVTALLVIHKIHASKHDGIHAMLAQLASRNPDLVARIQSHLKTAPVSARIAHIVLQEVVRELSGDPAMAEPLDKLRRRLAQPMLFIPAP